MSTRQRVQNRKQLVRDSLIKLEPSEVELYTLIGKARYDSNRQAKVTDTATKRNKNDPYAFDIIGAGGELSFFKLCELYPKQLMEISPRSMSNKTDLGDLTLDGLTIDVKTTHHKTGMLLAASSESKNVIDIFALMVRLEEDLFCLKGFYPSNLLTQQENFNRSNGKLVRPCYNVGQEVLLDYKDAVKLL
jgi:hypothetical protein